MLHVQHVTLAVPGLTHPVRLVQLTDLHFGWSTPIARLLEAVERTNRLEPDAIVLTGDLVHWRPRSVRLVEGALGRLRAPRVAVLGNQDHEIGSAVVTRALRNAGFEVLTNASAAVGPLTVVGVDDPLTGHADVATAAAGVVGPCVGLVHDPRSAPELWRAGVQVVLAGHTQVEGRGLKPRRGRFVAGLHHTAAGSVYVCPGVGSASWPPRPLPAIGLVALTPVVRDAESLTASSFPGRG